MLWLYLLGVVTLLTIALRRVLLRQKPLDDELYSKNVAVEHVQSGVAWVSEDGRIGSVNQSFARTFRCPPEQLVERMWLTLVAEEDRERAREAHRQMLLAGIDTFECQVLRADGTEAWLNARLVAGHDHHMRFVGHHWLIEDRTRIHELELQLAALEQATSSRIARAGSAQSESPAESARRPQKSPGVAKA